MTKWLIPLVLATILLIAPSIAHAQEGISLLDSTAEIYFPSALVFKIKAQSQSDITKLRLHYQVDRMNYAQVTSEAWPDFTPSPKVETEWVWDMRKATLLTGAAIRYWWTIEDATGNKLITSPEVIRFDDLQYSWPKLTTGQLSLFWYKGTQSFADALMTECQQTLDRLSKDTGVYPEKPISIFVYASVEDLRGALIFPREWTGGTLDAEYGLIAIGVPANDLDWGKRAVAHELGHMVVNQMTFSPYGAFLPLWLAEGLAMHAEGKPEPYYESVLRRAISQQKLISVRSLSSPFSAIPEEANISYAESQSLVEFLIQNYGKDKILHLLNLLEEGNSCDEAMAEVYGFDQDGLDIQWQEYITSQGKSQSALQYDSLRGGSKDGFLWDDVLGKLVSANILLRI